MERDYIEVKAVPLDHLYSLAIVSVLAEHPAGLAEERLRELATDWLLAVKHTLVNEL
jgi:hypothetical protein